MKYVFTTAFCFLFAVSSWGQSTSTREAELKALEDKAMRKDPISNRQNEIFKPVDNKSLDKISETDRSVDFIRNRNKDKIQTKEDKKQFEIIRAPNPEDLLLYADFLTQKNTGIFKLFPDLGCDLGKIVKVDGECSNAVTRSSSYSFFKKDYTVPKIALKEGNLVSDSFLSQNIIVSLGDRDINSVSLQTEQAKYLVEFTPETKSKKAKEQFWKIAQKVRANGFIYGKVAKIYDFETYLIRIIAYRYNVSFPNPTNGQETRSLVSDSSRRDKIIAFKVIRRDHDGSITIVWKELTDKKSPVLEFEKNEKLSDLKDK